MTALETIEQVCHKENIVCEKSVLLSTLSTFRIGGPAALVCMPLDVRTLKVLRTACRSAGVRSYVLGHGSNVLFSDAGFDGVIIRLCGVLDDIKVRGTSIKVGAGALLSKVCRAARDAGLSKLEFAYGIPGCVGGAVYMNAGAYGGEMKNVLQSVSYLDENDEEHTLPVEELALGYRTSIFEQHPAWCVLSATVCLEPGEQKDIAARMEDYMSRRRDKQPLEMPSAGSTFKRPEGAFAGALIDECGLRGYSVGGAAISDKHCGFVVNKGNATCADVLRLANEVSKIVKEKTGYTLEKEVRIIE